MIMSLPVIPIPTEVNHLVQGKNILYLPWHIHGGGVASKEDYDTNLYDSYFGLIPVPLFGELVTINSFRLTGCVNGQIDMKEGAYIHATLLATQYAGGGQYPPQQSISEIIVDRRNITNLSIGNPIVDILNPINGFIVSASTHTLGIGLSGYGQGFASIKGLSIDFSYGSESSTPSHPSGLTIK